MERSGDHPYNQVIVNAKSNILGLLMWVNNINITWGMH